MTSHLGLSFDVPSFGMSAHWTLRWWIHIIARMIMFLWSYNLFLLRTESSSYLLIHWTSCIVARCTSVCLPILIVHLHSLIHRLCWLWSMPWATHYLSIFDHLLLIIRITIRYIFLNESCSWFAYLIGRRSNLGVTGIFKRLVKVSRNW